MAYAKLVGKNLDNLDVTFDVTYLPCKLGRQSGGEGSIVLHSSDPQLSRTHAELFWNESLNKICIKVLSKNGIVVDKVKYKLNDEIELNSKSAMKIGGTRLYILCPTL